MSDIYHPSGGYRKLHAFNFATIIHLGTISFCKRYLSWKDDPLGKMLGQMIGASRSGKQNIVEGSERAKTSSETEIKLIDVAKASLSELQGDLEDYLVQKGQIPWSIRHPDHRAVLAIMLDEFSYTEDLLHDYWTFLLKQKKKFDPWLEDQDDVVAANALIILIQRATGLLGRQLKRLESDFIQDGGFKEKMYLARTKARTDPESPACPDCGGPMRQRSSTRGPFWGCARYPECKGLRPIEPTGEKTK
ncbi:MAG TPA: four helix bundle suffix domain-containing protein [Kiritimatiellia bacterium]|nr:four helix bundle suffix domain-containing protein [Kiritimatiellia bacterium]HMP00790.1 four helix bundle suffix domain-containing protein [Kiritimatiellia bacterium]